MGAGGITSPEERALLFSIVAQAFRPEVVTIQMQPDGDKSSPLKV
jgi:hypothetical protein